MLGISTLSLIATNHTHGTWFRRTTKPTHSSCCAGIRTRNHQSTTIPVMGVGYRFCREVYGRIGTIANSTASRKLIFARANCPTLRTMLDTTRWEIRPSDRQSPFTCTPHRLRHANAGIVNKQPQRRAKMLTIPNMAFSRPLKYFHVGFSPSWCMLSNTFEAVHVRYSSISDFNLNQPISFFPNLISFCRYF